MHNTFTVVYPLKQNAIQVADYVYVDADVFLNALNQYNRTQPKVYTCDAEVNIIEQKLTIRITGDFSKYNFFKFFGKEELDGKDD